MVITIDGPAGSGKSTAARKLAAKLELPYLDTGAMYRALAYAGLQRGIDLKDQAQVVEMARSVRIELDCGPTYARVRVDGHDVSEAIRTMAVSAVTSHVAKQPEVRVLLVEQQREVGRKLGSFVTEGRDQGSVVFPDAEVKFVLDASVEKRAVRRYQEMSADGENVTLDDVRRNICARDEVDAKQWAALLKSGAAIIIDTSHMSIADVVDQMTSHVQRAGGKAGARPRS
jgi:cytidylate kinase